MVTEKGYDPYLHNIPKEEWPAEGENLKLVSTEIYQSINPFWIIVLTPVIVGFFGFMSRGKGMSTPSKFAWGTIIAGLSSLIMVIAALSTNIYEHKVSSAWIIASYGVFTISELFMSPVGLVTGFQSGPTKIYSINDGGMVYHDFAGWKNRGMMTGFWDHFDSKAMFFGISAADGCRIYFISLDKKIE